MGKTCLLLAFTALGLINSAQPGADIITGITIPASKTGQVGTNAITFSIKNKGVTENEKTIYLSTSEANPTPGSDPSFIITGAIAEDILTIATSFEIPKPGTYFVYVSDVDAVHTLQKNNNVAISIVITDTPPAPTPAPAATIITKIEATNPEANKAIKYKFTLADPGLKSGDKIFLTKETTLAKDTDKSVTLDAAATSSVEKEFTLAAKGKYTAYVNRGDDYIKQTTAAAVIEVGSSGYISLAFALILTILLF